jgi:lactoylglutathione lyase
MRGPGSSMKTVRNGIILNVEKFDDCVAFYRDLFGLEKLFEQQSGTFRLTCLEFGESYLMIETDGFAKPAGKSPKESPAKLRFNVDDIEVARDWLSARGIEAKINRYEWGSTIDLYDPDGNRVGIRDETTFRAQLGA